MKNAFNISIFILMIRENINVTSLDVEEWDWYTGGDLEKLTENFCDAWILCIKIENIFSLKLESYLSCWLPSW